MKTATSLALMFAGAGILADGSQAATTVFGGSATLRGGYGKNPSFDQTHTGASAVFGGDLVATLARLTGKGRTALTGTADVTQSTGGNGRTQNYGVQLSEAEQLNAKLSLGADVGYSDSTNPNAVYSTDSRDLTPIGDILTIGTHTRQLTGDVNGAYQWDAKDLVQLGANFAHTTYSTAGASAYNQYGARIGYLRTISAATRIGAQFSVLRVASSQFAASTSYSGGLVLTQQISKIWTFQGGVTGVLQKAFGGSFKTIGFNASLCGDYPRLTVCFIGSRESAASGIGGLRIDTQGGARLNYQISPRDSANFEATYDISAAKSIQLPTQHYFDIAGTYRRIITPRLNAGFSARYQRRTSGAIALIPGLRTNSYVGTANVSYSFGRTS